MKSSQNHMSGNPTYRALEANEESSQVAGSRYIASLRFVTMATNSPEGEIAAVLPNSTSLAVAKLLRESRHDFPVEVSTTRTSSRLGHSSPDIPRVTNIRIISPAFRS